MAAPVVHGQGRVAVRSGIIGLFGGLIPFKEEMPVSEANVPVSPQHSPAREARTPRIRPLRIAIFGFGTVGSSVARILVESKPEGLELTHVFNRGVSRKKVDWAPASVVWSEDAEAVLASDVDVIVELAGGLDPAGPGCERLWRPARAW